MLKTFILVVFAATGMALEAPPLSMHTDTCTMPDPIGLKLLPEAFLIVR
jgi:hypothetical protein